MSGYLIGSSSSGGGGSTPTGTGIPHVVGGVQNAAASLIVNADVNAAAAIALSKIVNPTGTGLVKATSGVFDAATSLLVNVDVSASAAVDGTKISPDFGSQNIITTGSIVIGTSPATTGDLRTKSVWTWDKNTTNQRVMELTSTDVYVGNQTTITNSRLWASGSAGMAIASNAQYILVSATNLQFFGAELRIGKPIVGDTAQTSPYGVHGTGTQAMADANQTPAAAVYSFTTIKCTGVNTADRNLLLPNATTALSYTKNIVNNCTGAFNIVVKRADAAGTTVSIPSGYSCVVQIDSTGAIPITPIVSADATQITLGSVSHTIALYVDTADDKLKGTLPDGNIATYSTLGMLLAFKNSVVPQ